MFSYIRVASLSMIVMVSLSNKTLTDPNMVFQDCLCMISCMLFLWTLTKQVQTHAGPSDTYKQSHFAHVLSLCQLQIFFLYNLFISKHLCSSLRGKYNDLKFPIFIRKYTHCAICLQRANYLILICKYNLSKTLKKESRKNSKEESIHMFRTILWISETMLSRRQSGVQRFLEYFPSCSHFRSMTSKCLPLHRLSLGRVMTTNQPWPTST